MQSFGFSLPLTLSTLVTYAVLFFAEGFRSKKDFIAVGNLFYLDKPQGKPSISNDWGVELLFSLGSKIVGYFSDWIFTPMAIKNEDHGSRLVSNVWKISECL